MRRSTIFMVCVVSVFIILSAGFCGWAWDILVVQPMNRQTIDNNATRQIQVNEHFHTLASDIHTAYIMLQTDQNTLDQFRHDNPDVEKLPYQMQQQYQQLVDNVTGDKNALVNDCNQYAADLNNSDYKGYDSNIERNLPECSNY